MAELQQWIAGATGHNTKLVALPDPLAAAMARFGGWLPGAPLTWDQWLMLQQDNVTGAGAVGFDAFGIDPAPLAAVAPKWLVRYRKHGRFSLSAPA
jgi:NADH dehydrogenase